MTDRFKRVLIDGLQPGVEYDECERRDVPDAVEQHEQFERPALR